MSSRESGQSCSKRDGSGRRQICSGRAAGAGRAGPKLLSIADAAGNAAAAVALPAAGDAAGVTAAGGRCFAIRARRPCLERQLPHSRPRVRAALEAAEAPDIIEAQLDKDTTDDAEEGASEAGRPRGAAAELSGVQGWIVTHAGERGLKEGGHSRTELVFLTTFRCARRSARAASARAGNCTRMHIQCTSLKGSLRRQGEAVD